MAITYGGAGECIGMPGIAGLGRIHETEKGHFLNISQDIGYMLHVLNSKCLEEVRNHQCKKL